MWRIVGIVVVDDNGQRARWLTPPVEGLGRERESLARATTEGGGGAGDGRSAGSANGRQKRPGRDAHWASATAFFLKSNFRLFATMRSRSKKGEAGLCCAQSCNRPEPIENLVLPTEIQPESLNRSRGRLPASRIVSAARHGRLTESAGPRAGSETIHHNPSPRKPFGQCFSRFGGVQTMCRRRGIPVSKPCASGGASVSRRSVVQ